MNELCSPKNIAATARKFAELEKQHGPYVVRKVRQMHNSAKPEEYCELGKGLGEIPA